MLTELTSLRACALRRAGLMTARWCEASMCLELRPRESLGAPHCPGIRVRVGHRTCTSALHLRSLAQMMNWRWLLLFVLAWVAWDRWQARPIVHPAGVLASADPVQTDLGPSPPRLSQA